MPRWSMCVHLRLSIHHLESNGRLPLFPERSVLPVGPDLCGSMGLWVQASGLVRQCQRHPPDHQVRIIH